MANYTENIFSLFVKQMKEEQEVYEMQTDFEEDKIRFMEG